MSTVYIDRMSDLLRVLDRIATALEKPPLTDAQVAEANYLARVKFAKQTLEKESN